MALRAVASGERKSIQQLAREKWRSSGLTDRQAKRLRFRALSARETALLGSNFFSAGSLYIPYFDLQGKPVSFFRVRYLENLPGFAGVVEKKHQQRYAQEIHTLNDVYLPPLFGRSWEEISEDSSIVLYITEGELKAAAGCAAGLATIGTGGVDVWRASKRGITFLPTLVKFAWKERLVRIVFDSDLAVNPDVVRAQRALAQELLARGAKLEIINIPAGEGGEKQGLDDFLVARGGDALEELVAEAAPFPESDALWEMNEDVLVVRDPGVVAERRTGKFMDVGRFTKLLYANRHYMDTITKGKSTTQVRKPLAPRWVEWEHRAEVEKIIYEPGKPREHNGCWNVWPGWGCQPKRGEMGPWHALMDFLFKDQHKIREWFEKWCAYPLQHPGTKMYSAVLLWSREKRMGKGLAMYSLMKIYGHNAIEINNKTIKGDFNTWAKNRQFVYADEIRGAEAKIDADWLKNIITSPTVTINEKFVPQYVTDNHMNHTFTSNHPDALFLEENDQRYMVHETRGLPAERSFYEKIHNWLHGSGPSHLFHYLSDLNLRGFNPREHAPNTEGKRAMMRLGMSDAAYWVAMLREDPTQALARLGPGIGATCDLYTPRQLHKAMDPEGRSRSTEAALGRALAAAGVRQLNHGIPVRTSLGLCRLYPVRNQVEWEQATRAEIAEHFDKFWAPENRR
jgi:hypothetical protein